MGYPGQFATAAIAVWDGTLWFMTGSPSLDSISLETGVTTPSLDSAEEPLNIGTGAASEVNIGSSSITTTINGDVVVLGTTTIFSTVVDIKDRVIHVNHIEPPDAPTPTLACGISVHRGDVGGTKRDHVGLYWLETGGVDPFSPIFLLAYDTAGDDTPIEANAVSLKAANYFAEDTVAALCPQVFRYPGVAGNQSTTDDSWVAIGALIFDPSELYEGNSRMDRMIKFEAVIETSAVAAQAEIRLYNVDDGEEVTGTLQTTTSTTPTRKISAELTVGAAAGNVKNAIRTYEVQIQRNGGLVSDFVSCKLAQLKVHYYKFFPA